MALGTWAQRASHRTGAPVPRSADGPAEVLIGMDTRESGPWLAAQVAGGLARAGVSARFAGVITTPGVAYLTRTGPFVAGVMISASHNPYHDNGLKVISHSGYKLADEVELQFERLMADWLETGEEAVAEAADGGCQPRSPLYELSCQHCGRRVSVSPGDRLRQWLGHRSRAAPF